MDKQQLLNEMKEATLLSKEYISVHKTMLNRLKMADLQEKKDILKSLDTLRASYQQQIKKYEAAYRKYLKYTDTKKDN